MAAPVDVNVTLCSTVPLFVTLSTTLPAGTCRAPLMANSVNERSTVVGPDDAVELPPPPSLTAAAVMVMAPIPSRKTMVMPKRRAPKPR